MGHDTLRRWADTGKVHSYQTPGGHRRFLRSSLESMINGPRRARYSVERLTDSRQTMAGELHRRMQRASHADQPWQSRLSADQRSDFRRWGQRTFDLVIEYVAATKKAERQLLIGEAEKMGALYGSEASKAGLTLAETVEAFLYFRSPVLDAIVGASSPPLGRRIRCHRRLPRGERCDRQRARGAHELAPREPLGDDVQLGRGGVEALAAVGGAGDDVLDPRAPRVPNVDARLDAEDVAPTSGSSFEATMYGSSCVSRPMPWPVRWRNASP